MVLWIPHQPYIAHSHDLELDHKPSKLVLLPLESSLGIYGRLGPSMGTVG